MKKLSELDPSLFDGVRRGYVPPARLRIAPGLKLHDDFDADVDPITYEVIRHNLWNINLEHGRSIQRISGSPVAIYAIDLNPSILTEDAEFVYFGPYMQYMSGVTDTQVKWVLENRSENPGIRDGDMFLANDPWVGAAHQMDVMLMCPVFHEGELFCWVTNCLHQYDVGGIQPSSFCANARDAYDEGILIPPVKIIENNTIRADIEALYLRASRRPDMVGLDFRAQMAGNQIAKARIERLIARYGARVVKGVMKKIIDTAERAFLAKMAQIPDGTWQERTYVECAHDGDRGTYPVMITVHKRGTEIHCENEGTAPQFAAMNCTYSGWRGAIMVVLNQILCWEQYFAIGGALRHTHFDPTVGTMTCADFPAAVSTAPIQAMEIALYPAYNAFSKMIYSVPALRGDIMCMSGTSQWPGTLFQGIDQHGEPFGYGLIDPIGGAIGAFAQGDGISTGGQARTPISKLPNVEFTEHQFPILYLYRKELTDSGGPGRYRGGLGAESCFIVHHVDGIKQDAICSGAAIPTSLGIAGGYPAATNDYGFVRRSDIQARLAGGNIPGDIGEVAGDPYLIGLRESGIAQNRDDVYAVAWCGGGGFGDPFQRDPAALDEDIRNRSVSPEMATALYGAVLDTNGRVDAEATARRRKQLHAERLAAAGANRAAPESRKGGRILEATPTVHVHRDAKGSYWACAQCATPLGAIDDNFKHHALRIDSRVQDASTRNKDPERYIDAEVALRQYACPGCGTLLDLEVAIEADPPLRDIRLDLA